MPSYQNKKQDVINAPALIQCLQTKTETHISGNMGHPGFYFCKFSDSNWRLSIVPPSLLFDWVGESLPVLRLAPTDTTQFRKSRLFMFWHLLVESHEAAHEFDPEEKRPRAPARFVAADTTTRSWNMTPRSWTSRFHCRGLRSANAS